MSTTMQIKREELNPCTIKLDVVCSPDQVKSGFDKAYKGFAKQMRIPGFRPGHAPRQVVKKYVRQEDVNGAAAEEIIRKAIQEAITSEKIQPHDSPAVTLTSLSEDDNKCEFWAKVPLQPIVELGEYKGVSLKKPSVEVSDKEVKAIVDSIRKHAKAGKPVNPGAMDGDYAVLNIRKADKDDDGINQIITVGETFADLDKALTGMRAEEMKVVELSFPAGFEVKDLAGKKAKVRLTLKAHASAVSPIVNNAHGYGQLEQVADPKSEIGKKIDETMKEQVEYLKNQTVQEWINETLQASILAGSKVEVPDTMWESVANQRLSELDEESRRAGSNLEEYAKSVGMTIEEMVKVWQAEAKVQVQRAVIAQEIFKKESMKLSNEDLSNSLIQMSSEYGVAPQELADAMQKNKNFTELQIRGVFNKVIDFLNANAEFGGESKKPAKKETAAKAEAEPKAEKPKAEAAPKKKTAKKTDS
jgi:trigger factor